MTVCIVARTLRDQCIVSISDRMLSFSNDSIPAAEDATSKALFVSYSWRTLFAGDPSHVGVVLNRARAGLPTKPDTLSDIESLRAVQRAFREAYQGELQQQVTDRFLSVYGWTLESFKREALRSLGNNEFMKLNQDIRSFDLGVQFLVYGFDTQGFGHIFEVCNPGTIIDHDTTGYAVIGTGYFMAMGALAARPITTLPVEELIYRLCEAKFTSETAHGVGRPATLLVLSRNGIESRIDEQSVTTLRSQWEIYRKAGSPAGTAEFIRNAINSGTH